MNLRITWKNRKLSVKSDSFNIRLVMLIVDVFTLPKKSRYYFLMGLNCLLVLLLASVQLPVFYEHYAPVVMPATVILASTICKQGPPASSAQPYPTRPHYCSFLAA